MLIQMFFFILMLLGIAALTIDMGYVRLTQSLMQNAADTAALEGLRQRDAGDSTRRDRAKDMLDRAFIDPAGQRQMGAGPALTMDPPANEFNANQHYELGASPFFIPAVQSNQNNCVPGDMVAGAYVAGADHNEGGDYSRLDYAPVVNGDCTMPPDSAALASAPAFLVRLRRTIDPGGTYDPNSLDNQANISSSGSTLPMLFGRANVLESVGTHNPRHDGFAVRATAIANAKPALRVGAPVAGQPGATPFALDQSFWITLGSSPQAVCSDAFGNVFLKTPVCGDGTLAGRYYVPAGQTPTAQTVGALVALTPPGAAVQTGPGYVPIYISISGNPLVIGFGYAQLSISGGDVIISPTVSAMASANATAVVTGGFGAITPANLATALAANAALGGALLAPVLAR